MMGIMAPMVGSAEEAQFIVSCTRYPPKGRRGAAFGFAADDYMGGPVTDKIRVADARTLVMCLIETAEGIKNIDQIAAVPGVDVLWLGHFDLTNFLGIPGDFTNPKYLDAVERIVAAARRHKKGLGFMPASAELAAQYKALGFNMFGAGTDQAMLVAGVTSVLAGLQGKR